MHSQTVTGLRLPSQLRRTLKPLAASPDPRASTYQLWLRQWRVPPPFTSLWGTRVAAPARVFRAASAQCSLLSLGRSLQRLPSLWPAVLCPDSLWGCHFLGLC